MTPSKITAAHPFVKSAGGKTQLLPELEKHLPPFASVQRYLEPFVGGGALFWRLRALGFRGLSVLNDANEALVKAYQGVRDVPELVIAALRDMPHEHTFFEATREAMPIARGDKGAAAAAAWFIYLNKTGFNGLWRVNSLGQFNVPFGKYVNPTICNAPNLWACHEALANTNVCNLDFEVLLEPLHAGVGKGDLVYLDPPYWPLTKTSSFTKYTSGGFGPEDHVRLANAAKRATDEGAHVIASGSSAPESVALWVERGFEVRMVSARRAINSKGSARGAIQEMLAVSTVR